MAGTRLLLGLCLASAMLVACKGATDPEQARHPPGQVQFLNRTRTIRRGNRSREQQLEAANVTTPLPQRNTQPHEREELPPSSESEVEQEEESSSQQLELLLQRLHDRFTALQALDEQQLRKLESNEYRLTKLEVLMQEKYEAVRTEMREVSRRMQQLDWQSSKMEGALEAIKSDMAGLKHGQDQIRGMHGTDMRIPNLANEEIQNKMQMLIASIYSVRGAIGVAQEDLTAIKKNVSIITNTTNTLSILSKELLTTRHFTTTMLEAKQHTMLPVAAIPGNSWHQAASSDQGEPLPWDCLGVQEQGNNHSGVYRVQPPQASQPFFVYCEMDVEDGGWTVLQQRYEGTVDFFQGWKDYKHGFGNIGGEFWLGLEKTHLLTTYKVNELLIELEDFTLERAYAHYSGFAIGSEIEGYSILVLGKYDGTAGDSLVYHAGMQFSTHDMDQDNWMDGNCAQSHGGAWWYNGCDTSNLNGRYLNGEVPENYEYQGMYWYDWHGPTYSLMKSRMMVRPRTGLYTAQQTTEKKTSKKKHSKGNKQQESKLSKNEEPGSPENFDAEDNPLLSHVTSADEN